MNELDYLLKVLVTDFRDFMFIQTETGLILSKNGETIKNLLIGALKEFITLFRSLYTAFERMNPTSEEFVGIMHAMTIPLQMAAQIFGFLGEGAIEAIIMFKMLNTIIPQNTILTLMQTEAQMVALGVDQMRISTLMATAGALMAVNGLMFAGLLLMNKQSEGLQVLGKIAVVAAGALMGLAIAQALWEDPLAYSVAGTVALAAVGAAAMYKFAQVMQDTMKPPEIEYKAVDLSGMEAPVMDSGGMFMPMYDSGGPTPEHGLAMLQKGETVIPKGQNMMSGQGVTINVHGDVYDGDKFAQKMALEMANALRKANDIGGI